MSSRSGKAPVSRTLRGSQQQEVPDSASTIRYPSIPPSQDHPIPSVEEEEDLQAEQDPEDVALQQAMNRQFLAWAQAHPQRALNAMSGEPTQPTQPEPIRRPTQSQPIRQSTSDSSYQVRRKEFPHPPILEGDKESWIPFRTKMVTKIRNDSDVYQTTAQRLDYWASRLGDKPSKALRPYYNEYSELTMQSEKQLIDLLNMLYVNSNQLNEELDEYYSLHMKHADHFIDFFMEFWRLATSTGQIGNTVDPPFHIIQNDLMRRLPRRLREHQVYTDKQFDDMQSMRDYYVRVDNFFHQSEHTVNRTIARPVTSTNTASNTTIVRPVNTSTIRPGAPTVAVRSSLRPFTPVVGTTNGCYTCGSPDHFAKDCPEKLTRDKQVRFTPRASVAPGQVPEIHDDDYDQNSEPEPAGQSENE